MHFLLCMIYVGFFDMDTKMDNEHTPVADDLVSRLLYVKERKGKEKKGKKKKKVPVRCTKHA